MATEIRPGGAGVGYDIGNSATASITINKPSATAEGDILIANILNGSSLANTIPSGWTLFSSDFDVKSGQNYYYEFYYKIAGLSEPTNYTWSYPAIPNATIWASVTAVSGARTINPINASLIIDSYGGPAGQWNKQQQITTIDNNCLIMVLCASSSLMKPKMLQDNGVYTQYIPPISDDSHIHGWYYTQVQRGPTQLFNLSGFNATNNVGVMLIAFSGPGGGSTGGNRWTAKVHF